EYWVNVTCIPRRTSYVLRTSELLCFIRKLRLGRGGGGSRLRRNNRRRRGRRFGGCLPSPLSAGECGARRFSRRLWAGRRRDRRGAGGSSFPCARCDACGGGRRVCRSAG